MENQETFNKALNADINSFQILFAGFQAQLKSYLYRLLADRTYTEDLMHDTFIRAYDKIATFKQDSSLKTWVFTIATNLAYDHLKKLKRWPADAQDQGAFLAINNPEVGQVFRVVHQTSSTGAYEIKEHIDFCFTCISKTLPIENQVTLILKDIYDFPIKEICHILNKTEGVIKHLLNDARKLMSGIFENRCALINKNGVCDQCSQLNGIFNPKQDQQEQRMKLKLVKEAGKKNQEELYILRANLVKAIDPLNSTGTDLQDSILRCTRTAIGELKNI
ncbi:RNA polymerase sigma factor [Mucilaginibacter agri]|uniref:Sigma-70 family RNA polymerase sigma factor n=1 Tax=Mucilaginibacter agri TaxID=2695265 RepID=A0A965ZDQ3_9SPHI|nr:RNA polymerase sigma factor [Mucilaginibacter agri]NCD68825.1 sigma-70 family RNA polymerase sigma factor [Mucilaginibacter agri]